MSDNAIPKTRPLVVELVGPAGVGKTTLLRVLNQQNPEVVAGVHPHRGRYAISLISNTLLFLPTFLWRYRKSRWFTWNETRSMMHLKAWYHILKQKAPSNNLATILDHGPIFILTQLREFGPVFTKSELYDKWWHKSLDQWGSILDLVIWLDAPDAILLERIFDRNRRHKVKQKSEEERYDFLARYRESFQSIKVKLAMYPNIRNLHFQTDQKPPEHLADEILAILEGEVK